MSQLQPNLSSEPIIAALAARTAAEVSERLARTAGTHALLLDAIGGAAPETSGLGRWTTLRLGEGGVFEGPLRAHAEALPFCDNSFGAVVIRHLAGAGMPSQNVAREAARVLAPHGVLLVIECHAWSAWSPWWNARRKRGEFALRGVPPRRWRNALQCAGLAAGESSRCGAAWPRTRETARWLEYACGAAWVMSARKRDDGMTLQRLQPRRTRKVAEQAPWMPGARRVSRNLRR